MRTRAARAGVLAFTVLAAVSAAAADSQPEAAQITALEARITQLESRLAEADRVAERARDRGDIENVFAHYMYLHNAFQDEQIIPLWVKRGTPGVRARYTNAGQYTDYDSVIRYHKGRPTPVGKLILHATTTRGGMSPCFTSTWQMRHEPTVERPGW